MQAFPQINKRGWDSKNVCEPSMLFLEAVVAQENLATAGPLHKALNPQPHTPIHAVNLNVSE